MEEKPPVGAKTALVTIIGRPSAGKSTFLNTASGEEIAIVSSYPQTTRNAIRGIVNTSLGQLVFVDTPGYHDSEKKMNLRMKALVTDRLDDADCILYVVDSTRACGEEEKAIAALLKPLAKKVVIAINKTDDAHAKPQDARQFVQEALPDAYKIVPMSAKDDSGVDDVLRALFDLAPEGPHLYGEEFYTDQEVDFRIAEVIREQAMIRVSQEIPHAIYVKIADMEMRSPNEMWVRAFLCVERESQKGILIGKGANLIKTIRLESNKKLRRIFPYRIDLDLQVKVDKNWRQKDSRLDKLIT
ncbi:MAG: GTPase Era [Treponemataceae bacterium]|nr:GTPase Era [Treponema sp.]MDE6704686.1 GTPase Era [Treponemataceae bacterium]MDE7227663.1 GTPase Era [Treponemataceae bacterium]